MPIYRQPGMYQPLKRQPDNLEEQRAADAREAASPYTKAEARIGSGALGAAQVGRPSQRQPQQQQHGGQTVAGGMSRGGVQGSRFTNFGDWYGLNKDKAQGMANTVAGSAKQQASGPYEALNQYRQQFANATAQANRGVATVAGPSAWDQYTATRNTYGNQATQGGVNRVNAAGFGMQTSPGLISEPTKTAPTKPILDPSNTLETQQTEAPPAEPAPLAADWSGLLPTRTAAPTLREALPGMTPDGFGPTTREAARQPVAALEAPAPTTWQDILAAPAQQPTQPAAAMATAPAIATNMRAPDNLVGSRDEAAALAAKQYEGPGSMAELVNKSGSWDELLKAANASDERLKALTSFGGQQAELQRLYGNEGGYGPEVGAASTGKSRLDAAMMGLAGGQDFEALQKQYGGLGEQLGNANAQSLKDATAARGQFDARQAALRQRVADYDAGLAKTYAPGPAQTGVNVVDPYYQGAGGTNFATLRPGDNTMMGSALQGYVDAGGDMDMMKVTPLMTQWSAGVTDAQRRAAPTEPAARQQYWAKIFRDWYASQGG